MATSKPTNLKLTRKGESITATWAIPKGGYDSQIWQRYPKADGTLSWGTSNSIGKAVKTKTITFDRSDFFPNKSKKCTAIKFRVKGTKSKKESAWTTISKKITVPNKASVSRTAQSTDGQCKFDWSVDVDTSKWNIYTQVQITSVLVNNGESNEAKVNWSESHEGTTRFGSTTLQVTRRQWTSTATSGSVTITEDESLIGTGTWTRWFKVVAQGPAGAAKAVTKKYTYASPGAVTEDNNDSDAVERSGGMTITVDYSSQVNSAYPVDSYIINYMIATPAAGMQCPSWSGGSSYTVPNNGTDGSGKYQFDIASKPGENECLWTRVDAVHGTRTTLGEPKLVRWYKGNKAGYLSAPTNLAVSADTSSLRATISCSYSFTVPDSFIIVKYYDDNYPSGTDIAAWASGITSGTVTFPEPSGTARFGVYAAVISSGEIVSSEIVENNVEVTEAGTSAMSFLSTYYVNDNTLTLGHLAANVDYVRVSMEIYPNPYTIETHKLMQYRQADLEFTTSESGGVTVITIPSGQEVFNPQNMSAYTIKAWIQTSYTQDLSEDPSLSFDTDMESDVTVYGGTIPTAPEIKVTKTAKTDTVRIEWEWSWEDATHIELSWADHSDAWESTAEPDTYTVSRMRNPSWLIADLEPGQTYYFQARFLQVTDNTTTYGAYSNMGEADLRTNPNLPILKCDPQTITEDGEVTVSWVYSSDDLTQQKTATVYEVDSGNYKALVTVGSAQYAIISAQYPNDSETAQRWTTGTTHDLVVQVVSEAGRSSGYSEPITLVVAEPPTCSITASSLTTQTFTSTDESDDAFTYTETVLTTLPLTFTVTGANDGDTTTLIVERAGNYEAVRPNEDNIGGFEGETVLMATATTASPSFSFSLSDLIGRLDDGAQYRVLATVADSLGQRATATTMILSDGTTTTTPDFIVAWDVQPTAPTANVQFAGTEAFFTPIAPEDVNVGDTCDIYRLSIDKPKLIYKGATFGETYVDLYPTLGSYGGYRFVTVSKYDDYITGDGTAGDPAWTDYYTNVSTGSNIFDFNGIEVLLTYNIDLTNTAKKDFKQTTYLGGSVQGDWGKAVKWSGSVKTSVVTAMDPDVIEAMHRLMTYAGPCHVRTKDGSNYLADVQISEDLKQGTAHKIAEYSLTITRVDDNELQGITYDEWREMRDNPLAVEIDPDTGELNVTVEEGVTIYSNITLWIDDDTGELMVTEHY